MQGRMLAGFLLLLGTGGLSVAAEPEETLKISRIFIPLGSGESAFCVSLPEDGKLLAFQGTRPGGYGKSDIWFSRLENGRWSKPFNPGPGINTSYNESDPKFSADGSSIVFVRGTDSKDSTRVFISHLRNGNWSEAELIPAPISLPGAIQYAALLTRDGRRIYFSSSRKGGYGGLDNYYSERKGNGWGDAVNLGALINTAGDDADMAVSADGRAIIFPSKRSESIGGGIDLYISRRTSDGWSSPQNLGPRINTPGTDTCPWLGYDGQTLFVNSEWEGVLGGQQVKGPKALYEFLYPKGFK